MQHAHARTFCSVTLTYKAADVCMDGEKHAPERRGREESYRCCRPVLAQQHTPTEISSTKTRPHLFPILSANKQIILHKQQVNWNNYGGCKSEPHVRSTNLNMTWQQLSVLLYSWLNTTKSLMFKSMSTVCCRAESTDRWAVTWGVPQTELHALLLQLQAGCVVFKHRGHVGLRGGAINNTGLLVGRCLQACKSWNESWMD